MKKQFKKCCREVFWKFLIDPKCHLVEQICFCCLEEHSGEAFGRSILEILTIVSKANCSTLFSAATELEQIFNFLKQRNFPEGWVTKKINKLKTLKSTEKYFKQ